MIQRAKRVGFWWRTLAALLDAISLSILFVSAGIAIDFLNGRFWMGRKLAEMGDSVLLFILIAYMAMEIVFQGSPGKLCTGLVIANADGSRASRWTLANRWTCKWTFVLVTLLSIALSQTFLAWLGNFIGILVFLGCFAAMGETKLTWHDRWAHTAVFRRRDVAQKDSPPGFPVMPAQPMSHEQVGSGSLLAHREPEPPGK